MHTPPDRRTAEKLDIGHRRGAESIRQLLTCLLVSSNGRNRSAPFVRCDENVRTTLNRFVIATIPCWLVGVWHVGHQTNSAMQTLPATQSTGWRSDLLRMSGLGHDPANLLACFVQGLLFFVPVFVLALFVVSSWEYLFSTLRDRPVSDGLVTHAWLFSLTLPFGVELLHAAMGISFGFVVGVAVYGGAGRYLFNPIPLGVIFLLLAYPGDSQDTYVVIAQPGTPGGLLGLCSMLGALYLVATQSASWRIILGALSGVLTAAMAFHFMQAQDSPSIMAAILWHLLTGGVVFGIVFVATDPVPAAVTSAGRWLFGAVVGVFTVILREYNAESVHAVLFAILFASVLSPVIDAIVVAHNIRQRKRRATRRLPS